MIEYMIPYMGKPALYTPGTAFMWTDPHISAQLLGVHLNGELDLASRRTESIDKTIDWMLSNVPAGSLDILDLGCGPGLYTEQLAQKGHRVSGVDISAMSIQHARQSAAERGLTIDYRHEDYLSLNDENKYDLIMLIYTDLGVLLPDERQQLVANVYHALKPGGVFVFDVLNIHRANEKQTPRNWELSESGFWRDHPYLTLSESWYYPEQQIILYQHIVSGSARVDVYRFWTHLFSDESIGKMVRDGGFSFWKCFTDVLPSKDAWSGENVTFCVAHK